MTRAHTNRGYEEELSELRERVLVMAGRVEKMISDSIQALVERDSELAASTIEQDHLVNRAEIEADEMCLEILARRQPMASDLRFITLALKMVTDLERIADLAVNICERALQLNAEEQLKPFVGIPKMAGIVRSMVKDAIDAFVAKDAVKAQAVIDRDDEVDDLYRDVFRELLAIMIGEPTAVECGIHMQSVAKYLERMGDHGTNLAELVVFMVKGKDIRHVGKLGEE